MLRIYGPTVLDRTSTWYHTDGMPRHSSNTWWSLDVSLGCDMASAGIYEWRLDGFGVYVGQSKRLVSRIREYPNNVRKLIAEAPYRAGKPYSYREIHHHLRQACDSGAAVSVTVLENCDPADLNTRERYWIARRRDEAARGGPQVLNSERRGNRG